MNKDYISGWRRQEESKIYVFTNCFPKGNNTMLTCILVRPFGRELIQAELTRKGPPPRETKVERQKFF
jgi:hypothetical protein